VKLSWLFTPTFYWVILTRKVGQTGLVFGVQSQGSLVRLWIQDYKSAAVTIRAIPLNIQTDRQHFDQPV